LRVDCESAKRVALELVEFIEKYEAVLNTVTLDARRLKEVLKTLLSCVGTM